MPAPFGFAHQPGSELAHAKHCTPTGNRLSKNLNISHFHFCVANVANVASLITRVGLFSVLVCSKCSNSVLVCSKRSKPDHTCFSTTSHLRHVVLECCDGQVPSAYATDKRARAGCKPRGLCIFPQDCADPSLRTRAPSPPAGHPWRSLLNTAWQAKPILQIIQIFQLITVPFTFAYVNPTFCLHSSFAPSFPLQALLVCVHVICRVPHA